MNLCLIGYGAMGKQIQEIAKIRGHNIRTIVDPMASEATTKTLTSSSLQGIDVAIDFTNPQAFLKNIDIILQAKVNLVIGTTGWHEELSQIKEKVTQANVGVLWSSNFSIGVNVYFKVVEAAARLINDYDEYDVWGQEIHHRHKVDSPSGTAKTLEKILLDNIKRKTDIVEDKLDRKIAPQEIHFSSTRGGDVNFAHTIGFDSAADTITITHNARNRSGYALGAVKAAEWIVGKRGFFGMEDFLK